MKDWGLEGKSYFCSKFIRDALVRSLRITDDSCVLLGESAVKSLQLRVLRLGLLQD
jgi:hypothetical protein